MCRALEEMQNETAEKTRKKTQQEERHNFASDLLKLGGFTLDTIARLSRLPLEDVRKLAEEMSQ